MPLRVARPLAVIASSVTSWPDSNRASRSSRFTGWVWVRNGSNGIDFFMCGPRSLRIRMWIGFWPPSKRARRLAPEREPQPFWPRPEVLPVPEPSPRPTRLRGRREPGAGLRLCRPISSSFMIDLPRLRRQANSPRNRRQPAAYRCRCSISRNRRQSILSPARGGGAGLQPRERRVGGVERVVGPEALGEDVVETGQLEHRAHATAGEGAGTGVGGPERPSPGTGGTCRRLGARRAVLRHAIEVL